MTPDPGTPDPQAQALLAAILSGERSLEDADVRKWLELHPEMRARIQQMQRTAELLQRTLAEERAVREGWERRSEPVLGDELVAQTIQRLAKKAPSTPTGTAPSVGRRTWIWGAMAAAAVALFATWWTMRPGEENHGSSTLLTDPIVMVRPLASVSQRAEYAPFEWKAAANAAKYEVTLFDGATGFELLRSPSVRGLSWTPTPAQIEKLPLEIEWQVTALGATGEALKRSRREKVRAQR